MTNLNKYLGKRSPNTTPPQYFTPNRTVVNNMVWCFASWLCILAKLAKVAAVGFDQGTFQIAETSSGQPVCGLDQPSYVLWKIRSKIECSLRCLHDEGCMAVNYLANHRSCALFVRQLVSTNIRGDCQLALVRSQVKYSVLTYTGEYYFHSGRETITSLDGAEIRG